MLCRSCLAVLIAASLIMWLLPASAACRNSRSPGDHTQPIETTRHQPIGNRDSEDHSIAEAAKSKQTPAPADPHAEQIKRGVRRIGLASKITVLLKNGDDVHGTTTAIDQDKFQVAEVDLHQVLTIEYKDVRKVRSGYGGLSLFTGRHISQPNWVKPAIFIALVGFIIVLPLVSLRD